MSLRAMTWAFSLELKPSSLKFLLVALADSAGEDGKFWPSLDAISAKTSQDRKTVIAGLDALESMGLLVDTGRRVGRTNQVKVYLLNGYDNGTNHYVYRVHDPKTGEFYIGLRSCSGDPVADTAYMGSGAWPLMAMRDGRKLKKEVIAEFSTREDAARAEVDLIRANGRDPLCMNSTGKGTGSKSGTVPNFRENSTVFPAKESRFSAERVPKTVHGTVMEPSEEPSRNTPARASLSDNFESFLDDTYPRTAHGRNVVDGCHRAQALVGMGLVTEARLRDRLVGFRAFVDSGGYSGPNAVPSLRNWLDHHHPERYWERDWEAVPTKAQQRLRGNIDATEQWLREQEERDRATG